MGRGSFNWLLCIPLLVTLTLRAPKPAPVCRGSQLKCHRVILGGFPDNPEWIRKLWRKP